MSSKPLQHRGLGLLRDDASNKVGVNSLAFQGGGKRMGGGRGTIWKTPDVETILTLDRLEFGCTVNERSNVHLPISTLVSFVLRGKDQRQEPLSLERLHVLPLRRGPACRS